MGRYRRYSRTLGWRMRHCQRNCITFFLFFGALFVIMFALLVHSSWQVRRPTELCIGDAAAIEDDIGAVELSSEDGTDSLAPSDRMVAIVMVLTSSPASNGTVGTAHVAGLLMSLESVVRSMNNGNYDGGSRGDGPLRSIHLVVAGTSSGSGGDGGQSPARAAAVSSPDLPAAVRIALMQYEPYFASITVVRSPVAAGDRDSGGGAARLFAAHLALHAGLSHVTSRWDARHAPSVIVMREGALMTVDSLNFLGLCGKLIWSGPFGCSQGRPPFVSPDHKILLASASWSLEDHHPLLEWRYSSPLQDRFTRLDSKLSNRVVYRFPFHPHARLFFHAWLLARPAVDQLLLPRLRELVDNVEMMVSTPSSSPSSAFALPAVIRRYCNCVSVGRFVAAVLAGPHSFFLGPERMRARRPPVDVDGVAVDLDDTEMDPPPLSDEPDPVEGRPLSLDELVALEPPDATLWQSFRALFPQFRCPDLIVCVASTGTQCGSFRWSTCFDGDAISLWPPFLRCRVCSKATLAEVNAKCQSNFPSCCASSAEGRCTLNSPFFV